MSRAERRAYQRLNKNRDPYSLPVPPAQRARLEKVRARRAAAREQRDLSFSPRYLAISTAIAFLVALGAFSLQWSNGPGVASIAGAIVFVIVLGGALGLRLLQRRSAAG